MRWSISGGGGLVLSPELLRGTCPIDSISPDCQLYGGYERRYYWDAFKLVLITNEVDNCPRYFRLQTPDFRHKVYVRDSKSAPRTE